MTKVPELGQQILKAKYYAPGETEPEHLFRRVARVGSIPDAIDKLIELPDRSIVEEVQDLWTTLPHIFGKYTDLATRVLVRRGKDQNTRYNVPSSAIDKAARSWEAYDAVYFDAMVNLDFLPATPILISAGRNGMLSSCFFLRIEDSMESIFETVKKVAIISQKGGGCGLDFSQLRPESAPVKGTNGKSSGPLSFMRVFNETGNQVKGGGIRRAAMLAGLSVTHPDILKFIHCKDKEGEFSNFNLSVFIPNSFMEAVEKDKLVELVHPTVQPIRISARAIWSEITTASWKTGEPGIIFQDKVNLADVFSGKYGSLGVNPCGEIPLIHAESCNLAAINLDNMTHIVDGETKVNSSKLISTTQVVTRFLDNVVDLNNYPLPEIETASLRSRKLGIGVMGLHDLLLRCKLAYGSSKSLEVIDHIFDSIYKAARDKSNSLGSMRGIPKELAENGFSRRNANLLTCQPTGTLSTIAGVSSGIEPVFQWEYTRKDSYGEHKVKHIIADQVSNDPTTKAYAKTALEIPPEVHVQVQAEIQKFIDQSISKTINCPFGTTVEEVSNIYKLAYTLGCKSITVYRSGSRREEVLNKLTTEEKIKEPSKDPVREAIPAIRERPRILWGCTMKVNTPQGKCYITINEDKKGVREVLVSVAKSGSDIVAHTESEGRLISSSLKHNVPVSDIVRQLDGQRSSSVVWDNGRSIKSIPDAVAKCLQEYVKNYENFSQYIEEPLLTSNEDPVKVEEHGEISGELCPECGETMLMRESGCVVCKNCGNSRC